MTGRFVYLIVKIGGFPGLKGFANEGAICEEWSLLEDKAHKGVIAVDLVTVGSRNSKRVGKAGLAASTSLFGAM
jgi:hypothetical protein